MGKVIGPGSLIVDITGFAPHLPVVGETVMGSTLKLGPGGKGNNQHTAAHRAGAEAVIIGCMGKDMLGQIMKNHYATENMSTKHITVLPAGETGSALIEVDEADAQNRIIVVLGANGQVSRDTVLAAEADFADCDAVLSQFETPIASVLAAKELARKYNKPFILNPAPFVKVSEELFDGVDYVTPNETEAEQFTGIPVNTVEDCRAAARVFFQMGVKNVIITLGSRGVYFNDGKQELTVPALKVKPVETTGAGDAFNGGFATAIAECMTIETALRFATCTAAISVTRYGSSPSMPYRHEILELLEKEFGIKL